MKYKSYAFWTSLSAAIVVLFSTIASAFGFETNEKLVGDIVMAVCGILIVFGVVKMPTQSATNIPHETEQIDTTDDEQEKK